MSEAVLKRLTSHWAEVDGAPIRWFDKGSGGPPILLVHGGGANSSWWFDTAWELGGRRILLMDFSGHGDSGHRDEYSVRQWADEIETVIDASGAGGVHLVAHSMGGRAATVAAARPGAQILSLTLVDSVIPTLPTEPMPQPASHRLYASHHDAVSRFRFMPQASADHRTRRKIAEASVTEHEGGWCWKFDPRVFAMTDAEVVNECIPRIAVPVGIIQAGDSAITTRENAEEFENALGRNALRVDFPGVGHHPMIDAPQRTAVVVGDVVARLDAQRLDNARYTKSLHDAASRSGATRPPCRYHV